MIDELEGLLPEFAGRASHARCFLHTTNLIAKSLIWQFDVRKNKTSDDVAGNDSQLDKLSEGLDEEECVAVASVEGSNDVDGIVYLTDGMENVECAAHEEYIRPVKLVLVKVRMTY